MAILAGKGTAKSAGVSGSGVGRDFLDTKYTVTADGTITDFDINIDTQFIDLKLKVWRSNGTDYDFIGESQEFTSLGAGIQNLVLSSGIAVLTGDIVDIWVEGGGGTIGVDADDTDTIHYSDNTDYTTTQAKSVFNLRLNFALSVQVNGTLTGGGGSVTVTDIQTANQKTISTNDKSIDFSGTYTGTPTALAVRTEYADDNETIADWTTFDATPSGNVFSDSVTVPASTRPINVLVRFTDDTGINDVSNDFYVGDFVVIFGESTALGMSTEGTATPSTGVFDWNSGTGALTTPSAGAGQITLANTKNASTGHAVFITNIGVGSTALLPENNPSIYLWNSSDPTSRPQYAALLAVFAAAVDLPCVYIIIGANDAFNNNVSKATLTAAYTAFFAQLRTDTKAGLPIIAMLTGRHLGVVSSDQGWVDDTLAQKAAFDADANVHYSTFYDQPLADNVHPNAAGYTETGIRLANAALTNIYSDSQPYQVPQVTSVVATSDTETTFNLSIPDGSDFTPSSSITDIALSADSFSTEVTISAVDRVDATSFKATHSSATVTDYRVNWGANPNITGIVKDNSARTLPLIVAEGVLGAATSTLNISITGIPDGTYQTALFSGTTEVFNSTLTYTSGAAITPALSVAASTALTGYVIDNEVTPVNGAVITGNTA